MREVYSKDLKEAIDRLEEFYTVDLSSDAQDMYTLAEEVIFLAKQIVDFKDFK